MKNKVAIAACSALLLAGTAVAFTESGSKKIRETLLGVKEVPVVSTTGHGRFEAEVEEDSNGPFIKYTLSFADLEGDVRQAHIHIAPPQNTGVIVLWLCQTNLDAVGPTTPTNPAPNPAPAGTNPPLCGTLAAGTLRENTVSGELRAADIIPQVANGIDGKNVADFNEIVALINAGKAYANVHTAKSPAGEIRAQLEHDHSGRH
jgi:CHRD domain